MGRCQGNGGQESTRKIFQGSGAKGKAKIFQETFKNKKGAWKFLTPPFNREGQSTCCSVSVQRSIDRQWREESEFEGELFNGGEHEDVSEGQAGGVENDLHEDVSARHAGGENHLHEDVSARHVGGENDLHEDVSARRTGGVANDLHEDLSEGRVESVENDLHQDVSERRAVRVDKNLQMKSGGNDVEVERNGKSIRCASESLNSIHPHARTLQSGVLPPCGSGGVSVGSVGSSRWAWGRRSARLSSPWCCPGCGLYGDGTLCMVCDVGEGCDQVRENSDSVNSRLVRGPEHRGGTKLLKASSGIQVGFPVVDNVPGNASLVDYLRWAPKQWPVEGWECRTVLTPWVQKVKFFFLAGGCEVVSTIMRVSEWYPVSTGPGEPLRTVLGWTPLLRTPSSGVWLFRGALRGEQLLATLVSSVDWGG